jgi:predicted site-specific integrase-resolvase
MVEATQLEMPGYTVSELQAMMGNPNGKEVWRYIREGRLDSYKDRTGRIRVRYGDAYEFIKALNSKQ